MNFKKIIVGTILTSGVVIGILLAINYDKVEHPAQHVAQESGKTNLYTNPQAKFSFKPPTSWNGNYKVNQYEGADADKILPSAKHVVQFDYATKDGKDSETLLMISVFTKTDWTRLSSEAGPPVGTSITESNDMVYVYTTPQSNPFDSQSEDGSCLTNYTVI
ncbi:hypothetical protein [Brevibacillus sp. RS1.1]|uniref:hypothetical protein n=1 Tax=Brevibacillus sp. RS1.1 TaxID=2738982 RepID=UPI0020C38FF4|nr:hypothetical protein [Brevibacillus sp. RS1.1]